MNRRGFLQSCLALAAAPAIMSVAKPMKLWTPPQDIVIADTLGKVSLYDGEGHIVQVTRSWIGEQATRFFVDDKEVSGIDCVEVTGDCVKIGIPGRQIGYHVTTPIYRPGQELHFKAQIQFPIERADALHVGSPFLESTR